jgi:hypothetical protein
LASNERLEDKVVNNKLAKAKVLLFFLVKKSYRAAKNLISISKNFQAPNTYVYTNLWKYNDLEY